jgi:4-amino-4-deoxychorismate lyase
VSDVASERIDRASAYGDGLFETIAIRDNKPRLWSLHEARLRTGCSRLGLPCPPEEILLAELQAAIAAAGVATEFATAKLTLSAANSSRGYRRDANAQPLVRIAVHPAKQLPPRHYQDGVVCRLCSTRLGIQPLLAGIKTLNRLEQVLARAEWSDPSVFEGFTLDTAGRLICGTMSNVFIVKESVLITPAITRCGVSGVMRRHLIGLLRSEQDFEVEVRDVSGDELTAADEVFISNSQFGVLPVSACMSTQWQVGPVTRLAQTVAAANGFGECVQ